MKYPKSFSLSLQKHFSAKPRVLDYDFRMAFKHLKIGSLLHSCGIFKEKGIDTMTLLLWIVLVPFLKKPMTSLWLSKHVTKELDAKKDTYYQFLNNERFNWRKLIYKLATKHLSQNNFYILCKVWVYSIVPFAMKFITDDVDLSQLLVRNLGSFGVFVCVKLTFDS